MNICFVKFVVLLPPTASAFLRKYREIFEKIRTKRPNQITVIRRVFHHPFHSNVHLGVVVSNKGFYNRVSERYFKDKITILFLGQGPISFVKIKNLIWGFGQADSVAL